MNVESTSANPVGVLQNRVTIVIGAGSCGPGWGNGKASFNVDVYYIRRIAQVFDLKAVRS